MRRKKATVFSRFRESLIVPFRLSLLMVLVFLVEVVFRTDLGFLGIFPRTYSGLWGVMFAPLLHGSMYHLFSNLFPVIVLGTSLYFFYGKVADKVFISSYLLTNAMVWLIGRPYYHIGASGLVYGLAMFLIALGIFKRSFKSLIISVVVILMYGGLIYGILPSYHWISWESHLSGAIVGVIMASSVSGKKSLG